MRKKTNDEFLLELNNINKNVLPLELYNGANNKILFRCLICGYEWRTNPCNILNGKGCPKCAIKRTHDLQRKDTNTFIDELKTVNKKLEVIGEYINCHTKIKVRCLSCSYEFLSYPNSLLSGSSCPKCTNNNLKSQSEFENELKLINDKITVLGKYLGSSKKIKCQCNICGTEWDAFPTNLLRNHGCPKCAAKKTGIDNRTSLEEFKKKLKRVNKNVEILEEYISYKNKIKTKCLKCGYIWNAWPASLLNNNMCPNCLSIHRKTINKMSNEEFMKKTSKNDKIKVLENYKSSTKKIKVQCLKCNRVWYALPSSIILGSGCSYCANNILKSQSKFESELKLINDKITVLGQYLGNSKTIKCKCNICGTEWNAYPLNLLKGEGCPKCSHTSTSFPEQLILESLKYVLGETNVESRNKNIIGEELDIFVPDYNLAIEYGSWFWHKSRYYKDIEKCSLCRKKEINLIIIMDGCNEKINYDCITFLESKNLGAEYNHTTLKKLIIKIINKYIKRVSFNEKEWMMLEKKAYEQSKKITTEQFANRLKEINDNIIVLSDYTRAKDKVKCLCKICNNEWEATPDKLLIGRGCPKCGHKKAWVTRKNK